MSEAPEIEPPRSRDGRAFSIAALAVSIVALAVTAYEANIERADQRASAWPRVQVGPNYSGVGLRVIVENKGVGPAIIREEKISVDGERVDSIPDMLDALLEPGHGLGFDRYRRSDIESNVIAAGESLILFGVDAPEVGAWDPLLRRLGDQASRVDWSICYCSVFGDCWRVSSTEREPEKARCPRP